MPFMTYAVITQSNDVVVEVKKSKFIAHAAFANSRETAMATLSLRRSQYADARHHCWAYLLGNPNAPNSAAMSDDGEPSGTAGKPILNVLQHNEVGDIVIVVSRYFGGIKLGASGLVRAYSNAAVQVVDSLTTQRHVPQVNVAIRCDFKDEQFLRLWVSQHQGKVIDCQYNEQVNLHLRLSKQDLDSLVHTSASLGASMTLLPD